MGVPVQEVVLEHTYAEQVPGMSVPAMAEAFPDPQLVVLNEPLAAELGIDPASLRTPAGLEFLTGQGTCPTHAQLYAGHQFGGYSPLLGDGRAVQLGEVVTPRGRRVDVSLKGSGTTPITTRGDGRAALGPMLREYLVSEAMHALGIPTTRALAVLTTGERVIRQGSTQGALLVRVAASHLRVGTFQFARDQGRLEPLMRYAIARHWPAAASAADPALALLEAVVTAQARLLAHWHLTGFVHGVMNTDNMTISGETIDFGPCAFTDHYEPRAVFSSIDDRGRYAFGNQPAAAMWNLARFAESLLPLIKAADAVGAATAAVETFGEAFEDACDDIAAARMSLTEPDRAVTAEVVAELRRDQPDITTFFRQRGAHNPLYIPRNHLVEPALAAAEAGNLAPFRRLLDAVTHPASERADYADLAGPPPPGTPPVVTYCGT